MLKKFRGTLFGALLGDCLGVPYEGEEILSIASRLVLRKSLDDLEGPNPPVVQRPYSDDSALTMALARSLIEKKSIDQVHLALEMTRTYYENPNRGYGNSAAIIYSKLRNQKATEEDPLRPARELFDGRGSVGNGASMRISPVALFYHDQSTETLADAVKRSAEITHTNCEAINGAIFQAFAIQQALQAQRIDSAAFIADLEAKMNKIENRNGEKETDYCLKLHEILRLLSTDPSDEQVINRLGNGIQAYSSVPTALYCFLRATRNADTTSMDAQKLFRTTIENAISLGGDTDTIASMAGALAGSFFGDTAISANVLRHCEGHETLERISEQLLEASQSKTN